MKRVFVLNDGGHNYADAARFGEITYCTQHAINKWDIAQMYRELGAALDDAQSSDYILVSSLASLCVVAVAIMAARFGEVHLLLYKDGSYIERDLMLDNGLQEE